MMVLGQNFDLETEMTPLSAIKDALLSIHVKQNSNIILIAFSIL